ncbi:hypothetical protein M0R45_019380 [Rubus argutus]|uniref:Uncharacterized protein n=1 Tax=Rubus argutus TaxID=59490 RepID=A0AAW1X8S9_RUBAR
MISLKRTVASKNVLHRVIFEYTSLKNELSSGQIGRIVMIILGSGKLNSELCKKLVKKLDCNPPWKDFIESLCASSPGPGNTSQEPREDEDTSLSSIVADVRPSIQGILDFVINVVSECLCNRGNLIEWIKKSNADWKSYYSLLVPRLIVLLCLLYVNFGMCLDILSNFLRRSYITEQLPLEFYDTLKWIRKHNSLDINVEVLAAALKKIDNTLVIASFGFDCSTFLCSDAIFFDMKANQCKDDIFRKMFPKPPVNQVEAEGNSSGANDTDAGSGKSSKLLPLNSSLVGETDMQFDGQSRGEEICKSHELTPKCPQPDASTSATQANKKGNRKKHKGRKSRK